MKFGSFLTKYYFFLIVALVAINTNTVKAQKGGYMRTELYFGLSIPNGGMVSNEAWQMFTDTCISAYFPEGLTVVEVLGQWKDQQTKVVGKEPSRMLIVVYPKNDKAKKAAIGKIQQSYMKQFQQQAVMRIDTRVKVSFDTPK